MSVLRDSADSSQSESNAVTTLKCISFNFLKLCKMSLLNYVQRSFGFAQKVPQKHESKTWDSEL